MTTNKHRKHWDLIVLGLGGVGSAAIYHAATAGMRVLGIDQYCEAHDKGSSHGHTRAIRQAYFEDPAYVPLLRRSYQLWESLQAITGQQLFVRTGLVEIGPEDGVVIPGVRRSAQQYQLDIEEIRIQDLHDRWPGLRAEESWAAVLEKNAGYLLVESCVSAHLRVALQQGAVCRYDEVVQAWTLEGKNVVVRTNAGQHVAERLIVAAGPWSGRLLASLNLPLTVLRKHQYWLEAERPGFDRNEGFPCFFFETPQGYFYGFPSMEGVGVKVARHSGGQVVTQPSGDEHPFDDQDFTLVTDFVAAHLPGVTNQRKSHAGCYYTMTPSECFIIDVLPNQPQVTVVAGLSGHGFKFTSVLGEIAATMSRDETPAFDLERFRIANHVV